MPRVLSGVLLTSPRTGNTEAQFIVPDRGERGGVKLTTTTLYHRRLYPPVRDYEFGYSPYPVIVVRMVGHWPYNSR
jgi:hypothetical protein